MKDRTILDKVSGFLLGGGFYIVLLLAVAAVGLSGRYLMGRAAAEVVPPAAEEPASVLPRPEPEKSPVIRQSVSPPAASAVSPTPIEAEPEPPVPVTGPEEGLRQEEKPTQEKKEAAAPLVFTWPVKGEVLRDFSLETLAPDPTMGDWRTHCGLDIAAPVGTQVLAMAAGQVTEVYEDGLMGTTVVVDHGEGLTSSYANLAGQPTVEPGDRVDTGTILGAVGQTAIAESGMSSHLHLEAWKDGMPADPTELLPEK